MLLQHMQTVGTIACEHVKAQKQIECIHQVVTNTTPNERYCVCWICKGVFTVSSSCTTDGQRALETSFQCRLELAFWLLKPMVIRTIQR